MICSSRGEFAWGGLGKADRMVVGRRRGEEGGGVCLASGGLEMRVEIC